MILSIELTGCRAKLSQLQAQKLIQFIEDTNGPIEIRVDGPMVSFGDVLHIERKKHVRKKPTKHR